MIREIAHVPTDVEFSRAAGNPSKPRLMAVVCAVVLALIVSPGDAEARTPQFDVGQGIEVNSERDRYLRVLQTLGLVRAYPWTVRGFSLAEERLLLPVEGVRHPWASAFGSPPVADGGLRAGSVPFEGGVTYNSTYPYGSNDGALWAGRGLTAFARGGVYARWKGVDFRFAPELFWAQNAGFDLAGNRGDGPDAYRDPRYPGQIDLPQRFGDRPYRRATPGSSRLSVELPWTTVGISSEARIWGPSLAYPLLLGDEAGGFPHVFLRSARPLGPGVLRVHGQLMVGYLGQSDWSPVQDSGARSRFMTGAVITLQSDVLPGFEIGVERFVQGPWEGGLHAVSNVGKPFTKGVSTGTDDGNIGNENQMAGGFVRWVVVGTGIEVFAEAVREDYGRDIRHFLVEPDDLLVRSVGFRRAWTSLSGSIRAIRGEFVSAQLHHSERDDRVAVLGLNPIARYRHAGVRQGHTLNGQLLAAPAAFGGSGWTLAVEDFRPSGRTTVEVTREVRLNWLSGLSRDSEVAARNSVRYGVSLDIVRFRKGTEIAIVGGPQVELNRNLVLGWTAWNLNLGVAFRGLRFDSD
ncbi:MAG: hypothetical protein HOB12_10245 [Gemmatimonadales bacterium]|nr:hypothetical protein [Gemmatimonadales bacterium]